MHCGLLGQSLKHSYSPAIHKALGGGYDYGLFEIEPENLETFLKNGMWDGLNVTIPYKQAVIPYCTELSETAKAIGSVNTILRRPDGSLFGDNTDAAGFKAMLRRSGCDLAGKKVLVLGSGGSSLTVCHILREERAGEIIVISRRGEHTYETLDRHADAQVIVNTTPLGMYPHVGESAVDITQFSDLMCILDLVYNPARTRLLLDAEIQGISHENGLSMLVGQAAAAAGLFVGGDAHIVPSDNVLNLLRQQMENLILIGMPGSGKSTIGRLLADCLNRPFVDTDAEIERLAGMTIPEIFKREGEEAFRARETEVLAQWGKESGLIIATGGGVVTREKNYPHLHQNGRLVFLERSLEKLDRTDRPLSKGDLQELYNNRLPQYQRFADCMVRNAGSAINVANKVWEAFNETLCD